MSMHREESHSIPNEVNEYMYMTSLIICNIYERKQNSCLHFSQWLGKEIDLELHMCTYVHQGESMLSVVNKWHRQNSQRDTSSHTATAMSTLKNTLKYNQTALTALGQDQFSLEKTELVRVSKVIAASWSWIGQLLASIRCICVQRNKSEPGRQAGKLTLKRFYLSTPPNVQLSADHFIAITKHNLAGRAVSQTIHKNHMQFVKTRHNIGPSGCTYAMNCKCACRSDGRRTGNIHTCIIHNLSSFTQI